METEFIGTKDECVKSMKSALDFQNLEMLLSVYGHFENEHGIIIDELTPVPDGFFGIPLIASTEHEDKFKYEKSKLNMILGFISTNDVRYYEVLTGEVNGGEFHAIRLYN